MISVVKTAEHRTRDHFAVCLVWMRSRRVAVEREMTASGMVVVVDILFEGLARVAFGKSDDIAAVFSA